MVALVHDVGRWFFFYFTLFLVNLSMVRAPLLGPGRGAPHAPQGPAALPSPPPPAPYTVFSLQGALFRLFAYILPDMESAQTAPGPIISLQVVFAGACCGRRGRSARRWVA